MKIRIEFTEPLLGTLSGNKEITGEFIVGRLLERLTPAQRKQLFGDDAKQKEMIAEQVKGYVLDGKDLKGFPADIEELMAEELDAIKATDAIDKASTIFPRDDKGLPFLWDYQVKGQLKGACAIMIARENHTQAELKAHKLTGWSHKKTIDTLVHPAPRKIPLILPAGCDPAKLEFKERPLRADTMRGERICLARSEMIPVGTTAEFTLEIWNEKLIPFIREWLGYGTHMGMLQWRSGGWGRYTWTEIAAYAE